MLSDTRVGEQSCDRSCAARESNLLFLRRAKDSLQCVASGPALGRSTDSNFSFARVVFVLVVLGCSDALADRSATCTSSRNPPGRRADATGVGQSVAGVPS